ncbi:MAG: DUF2851 family protein [Bacteroidales bacterium]|nr:DUF2851 family protein [Bacteroidales bacterium]
MKEEFLHYLWKYGLFDSHSLLDSDGKKISVIHPGEYNRDSGPDFFNARILAGDIEWAGNVEIHCRSSHFDIHGHNNDHAFDNVILHVVAENDKRVFNARGEEILTVQMKYDESLYERYLDLVNNPAIIACQNEITSLDVFFVRHWLNSVAIERLESKSQAVLKVFRETGNDWEETFYRILIRYFGFRVNTEPFEMLANSLPFRIIRKHADNRFQIEALLFGTAGMLEEGLFKEALSDDYYSGLVREYKILSSKYSLKPLHGWIWKFNRLRPVNFPTVRLSQLSAMLSVAGGLFSRTAETEDIKQLRHLFEVSASPYWDDHYIFGRKSRNLSKKTGSQATDILLINAVIPVIFSYGRMRDRMEISERALSFLENIPPEENRIISEWSEVGIKPESALFSQALIQLRDEYCRKRRCLECRIGSKLISSGKKLNDFKNLVLEP